MDSKIINIPMSIPGKSKMLAWQTVEYMNRLNNEIKSTTDKYKVEKDREKKLSYLRELGILQIKYVEFTK